VIKDLIMGEDTITYGASADKQMNGLLCFVRCYCMQNATSNWQMASKNQSKAKQMYVTN